MQDEDTVFHDTINRKIDGFMLKGWGYEPGAWFKPALEQAEQLRISGGTGTQIRALLDTLKPEPIITIPLHPWGKINAHYNLAATSKDEINNFMSVSQHMRELMRVPTVVGGAVLPDACPSDSRPGTIPVGGVVATKDAIHPGMHSADICCSMAMTVFKECDDPTTLLDAGMKFSHFGPSGRSAPLGAISSRVMLQILDGFANNEYLKPLLPTAIWHFGTQGDGNHFFYVGRQASTGKIALVTHHGSRKPGAMLYKTGMAIAEKYRAKHSPETGKHNAWIPAYTKEGATYWQALQLIRLWTRESHFAIHDLVKEMLGLRIERRMWNEHNFVFQKPDGLFYHAKGATPSFARFSPDDTGQTLIPLNMAEPILIAEHRDNPNSLGFAPHGAGRNFSRTEYLARNEGKTPQELFAEQTHGIDVRSFSGKADLAELPGAYKDAASVRAQIKRYDLARIVDQIDPIGSIMAGASEFPEPWRVLKAEKKAARA